MRGGQANAWMFAGGPYASGLQEFVHRALSAEANAAGKSRIVVHVLVQILDYTFTIQQTRGMICIRLPVTCAAHLFRRGRWW